jgi:hypothetical protein
MPKSPTSRAGDPAGQSRMAGLFADPPAMAVIAVCAVVLGLRRAQAWSNPQFWAEDVIYYKDALLLGWRAFTESRAGYLTTVPRAIAWASAHVDPLRAPAVFTAAATAATLYVASRALSPRCPLPRFAGLMALAVVLVPDTHEVLLNVVNLQWVLAAGLVLLLIAGDPERGRQWAHDLTAAALVGLTGPYSVILAPLFVGRAWIRRSRPSVVLAALVVACAAVQVGFTLRAPMPDIDPPGSTTAYADILPMIGRRVGGTLLLGSLLPPDTDQVLGGVAGALTLCGLGFLALRPGESRAERRVLGLLFAAFLFGGVFRTRHSLYLFFTQHTRARYLYLPNLIAIWLLVLSAVQKGPVPRICTALAVWALLVNIPTYREAAYVDMNWAAYADRIRAGEAVTVRTNPRGWTLEFPAGAK